MARYRLSNAATLRARVASRRADDGIGSRFDRDFRDCRGRADKVCVSARARSPRARPYDFLCRLGMRLVLCTTYGLIRVGSSWIIRDIPRGERERRERRWEHRKRLLRGKHRNYTRRAANPRKSGNCGAVRTERERSNNFD